MNFIRRNPDLKSIVNGILRFYSYGRKTHYEILNLRKNCSDKEIKDAFIRMSKKFHPDKNKDSKANEKFVHIVEAYNVLSKPLSRSQYDSSMLVDSGNEYSTSFVYKSHASWNSQHNPQYSYYYDTQSANSYYKTTDKERPNTDDNNEEAKSYYGVRGLKKVPNYMIICLCGGFAVVALIIQLFVIRESSTMARQQALERSKILGEELDRVRTLAKQNGNEVQSRLLLDKIVNGSNHTTATATLGQALVGDKK